MITKDFVTAGHATFTIEPALPYIEAQARQGVEVRSHYTFRVRYKGASEDHPAAWFVYLLTGPNNDEDYTYLGVLNTERGTVHLTAKSRVREDSPVVLILRRVLRRVWAGEGELIEAKGWKVYHDGRCGRCGHNLTTPASIESGIGPDCAAKIGL